MDVPLHKASRPPFLQLAAPRVRRGQAAQPAGTGAGVQAAYAPDRHMASAIGRQPHARIDRIAFPKCTAANPRVGFSTRHAPKAVRRPSAPGGSVTASVHERRTPVHRCLRSCDRRPAWPASTLEFEIGARAPKISLRAWAALKLAQKPAVGGVPAKRFAHAGFSCRALLGQLPSRHHQRQTARVIAPYAFYECITNACAVLAAAGLHANRNFNWLGVMRMRHNLEA